jgi:hypothetical protein
MRRSRLKRHSMKRMELVRHILGNEVFKDKETGKEYLVVYSKKGKSRLVALKEPKFKSKFDIIREERKKGFE